MIEAKEFVAELKRHNPGAIIEVPCSIFTSLINYLIDSKEIELINPVNEGIVMANAAGEYLATKKIPVVAMQNSGLNNTLNALTSLNKQYSIPAVYLISKRGEIGDAEEHNFMGPNLEKILDVFQIPFKTLSEDYPSEIEWAFSHARQNEQPVALIMRKGFINEYKRQSSEEKNFPLDRWNAIETVVDCSDGCVYISTNGYPSRVLFNILKQKGKEDGRAFYMIGSMGHALGIGKRIAEKLPGLKVVVIDGDGGALMHIGSMAGISQLKNLVHVILDNRVYGSTGGQPTLSEYVDFNKVGEGFGYKVYEAEIKEELLEATKNSLKNCPCLIHVKINKNEKLEKEMERVSYSCKQIRQRFEKFLSQCSPV